MSFLLLVINLLYRLIFKTILESQTSDFDAHFKKNRKTLRPMKRT